MSWNVKPRADNLDTLAVAYFRTGDVDDAIETQRKAIELLPSSDRDRGEWEDRLAEFEAAAAAG